MKRRISETLVIQDISKKSEGTQLSMRGMGFGMLIKMIRKQLGMPQVVLAKKTGVPQSTISRLENNEINIQIFTLEKILNGLSCDLVIAPILRKMIDEVRLEQAKKIARKRVSYIVGTMDLEKQKPDPQFTEALFLQEVNQLLSGPNKDLWNEEV